ncbi:MAG: extracellular solute-binding protein [Anaerolineae bacterium]|nr:extracellular solute-binding protein [Anaerolineae bacterium]MBT7192183.1 extracellular solute-binding protein [Anaerolineae bacterium]MBT7990659.1 extracellular solute-binding protein [Anaerolineae bacterium]
MTLKIIGPNDPALEVLEAALAQRPDLNAELEIIPWPEYRDALMATLQADVAPNQAVFVPGHIWLPEFADAGYLADITSLLADAPAEVLADYDPEDIIPSIADESKYQGKQYQLPFFSDGHILFYRSDLIELDESEGVPIVSTKELAKMAKTEHNPSKIYGLALKADASEIFTDFLPYLWEAGGHIFDEDGNPDVANEINIAALQSYCDLRQFCPPQTQAYGNGEIAKSIRKGEAALVANWGGQTAPLLLDADNPNQAKYKCATFPIPWNATWGIAIPANQSASSQRESLTTLLQLLNKAQDKEITKVAGSPVRQSSYAPEEMQKYRWLAAQREMLERAKPLPAVPELGSFLGELYGAVHDAFTGKSTPADALKNVRT